MTIEDRINQSSDETRIIFQDKGLGWSGEGCNYTVKELKALIKEKEDKARQPVV